MKKSILDGHQALSWPPFKAHIHERIEELRTSLEKSPIDGGADKAEKIRGRLAELRLMLNVVEPKPIKTQKEKTIAE